MIAITGANGFIGSVLVRELNQLNFNDIYCVDVVDDKKRVGPLSKARYRSFIEAESFLTKMAEGKISDLKVIFHMGACSSTTEMDVEYLKKNNTLYTQKLWNACIERGIPFFYASSGAVYGNGENGFDDATNPQIFKPLNPYGWSKLNFDTWALEQSKTPPRWGGYRFFNVYGPNEYHKGDMASVVFKAFNQIENSGKLKLFKSHNPDYNDGHQLRDFVYVKDVVKWMIQIWQSDHVHNGIYNMGYGQARPWIDLAKAVFSSLDKPLNIEWIDIPVNIRDQYQYYTEAKMTRLFAEGLSKPEWNLENGISDYVKGYLQKSEPFL